MDDSKVKMLFYIYIVAGALALIALGIGYFRRGEIDYLPLSMAILFFAMSIISRGKRPSGK